MSANVLTFGAASGAGAVLALERAVPTGLPTRFVLPRGREEDMLFEPYDGSLAGAVAAIEQGEVAAVQFGGHGAGIIGGVSPPGCWGSPAKWWEGWVEGKGIDAAVFEEFLDDESLVWIALCIDHSPEIELEVVTPQNFPWDFWLLDRAAVRDSGGEWVVRRESVGWGVSPR